MIRAQTLVTAVFVTLFTLTMGDARATEPLQIHVVNYPLKYFASRIAGAHAEVSFPAPTDIDPAFWRPSAETINAFQQADLIVLNGADYARWRAYASLPRSRLLDTSAAFRDRLLTVEASTVHQHGPGGEHNHGGTAFTTWLDFDFARKQASTTTDALSRLRPERMDMFRANYAALERELIELDRQMNAVLEGISERQWLASHPVYQYLATRYGLKIDSVTWEPDVYPDEAEWRALETLAKLRSPRRMLWEGAPLVATRERLAELGIEVIVFNPCSNRPESGDFIAIMRDNIENVAASLR